jgi:hypothetical protein
MLFSSQEIPRYERQLQNVNHLVLNTINREKQVNLTEKELNRVLAALYEWRIID